MDILAHRKCSVLLFPRKYHNYNENLRIGNIFFVNSPKRKKGPFNTIIILYSVCPRIVQQLLKQTVFRQYVVLTVTCGWRTKARIYRFAILKLCQML